jgi:hypothetical protein
VSPPPAQKPTPARPAPAVERARPPRAEPARPPVSEPPLGGERPRPARPGGTGPKVRITHVPQEPAPAPVRSRNLMLAVSLLVAAVALGIGIGALVANLRAQADPVPAPEVAANALTKRFLALRQAMDARAAQGQGVPERAQRLSHDAATALIQNDEASARLYIEEMERLLKEDEGAAP